MFYKISTQVPSQMGKRTVFNKTYSPWKVEKLHAIFDVWSEDDILKTSPCYFVTERLFQMLSSSALTGIEFDSEIDTDTSITFQNLYPNKVLPKFYLINILGKAGSDDFGLTDQKELIVSQRAHDIIRKFNTNETEIIKWTL